MTFVRSSVHDSNVVVIEENEQTSTEEVLKAACRIGAVRSGVCLVQLPGEPVQNVDAERLPEIIEAIRRRLHN